MEMWRNGEWPERFELGLWGSGMSLVDLAGMGVLNSRYSNNTHGR